MQTRKTFLWIGIGCTVIFLLGGLFSTIHYNPHIFMETFFHWPSLCIVLIGIVLGIARCGIDDTKTAFLDVFTNKQLEHGRIKKSKSVLISLAHLVWFICIFGAVVNYVVYNSGFPATENDFLSSLRFSLFPLLYGAVISNIFLLNLAIYLERKEIKMPKGLKERLFPEEESAHNQETVNTFKSETETVKQSENCLEVVKKPKGWKPVFFVIASLIINGVVSSYLFSKPECETGFCMPVSLYSGLFDVAWYAITFILLHKYFQTRYWKPGCSFYLCMLLFGGVIFSNLKKWGLEDTLFQAYGNIFWLILIAILTFKLFPDKKKSKRKEIVEGSKPL